MNKFVFLFRLFCQHRQFAFSFFSDVVSLDKRSESVLVNSLLWVLSLISLARAIKVSLTLIFSLADVSKNIAPLS